MRTKAPGKFRAEAIAAALGLLLSAAADAAQRTEHVILLTLDGVRTQEIFGGLDETIAAHADKQSYSEMAEVRPRYGAATPTERRAKLMPTFWNTLVPKGVLFGDAAGNAPMRVQNAICISSPGYEELMTGAPRADVIDNTIKRYSYRTALQAVAEERKLGVADVAQIGSWDGFTMAASNRDGGFVMSGGFDALPAAQSTAEIDMLVGMRKEVMGLWEEGSEDVLSYRIAKAYLRKHEPRLMWIGLGNSDDWAHADRYDRVLTYLNRADTRIADLWNTVQSTDGLRDRTTLIITTDHGRGLTPADWSEHGCEIPGSERIWALVVGPDTPATGIAHDTGELHQGQVAATILQYFGLAPSALDAKALPALPGTNLAK